MKKIIEYIAIPTAIKAYMLLGIILFRMKNAKNSITEYKPGFHKPALKHITHP